MNYLEKIFGLNGKVAVVTGGGRGIGQVIACGLAQAGAEIAILSRSGADNTLEMIDERGGSGYYIKTDVTEEDEVERAMEKIIDRSGSMDIVFNNAGICMHQDTLDATAEEFRKVIDVNLTGEFIVAQAAIRIMLANGIQGSIINMASDVWQYSQCAPMAGFV